MIVHIFGPCNSGKTTLRNRLKELHPEFESWCIDDFRRKIGDGTLEKELKAQDAYVEAIGQVENGFFESSGIGRCAMNSLWKRKGDSFIVIIDTPVEVCVQRIKPGKYDGIPFPFADSDNEIIERVHRILNSDGYRLIALDIPILHLDGTLELDE